MLRYLYFSLRITDKDNKITLKRYICDKLRRGLNLYSTVCTEIIKLISVLGSLVIDRIVNVNHSWRTCVPIQIILPVYCVNHLRPVEIYKTLNL